MELLMCPTIKSNQQMFRVYDVKDYKFIRNYTVEVEFNDGDKENFYAIDSVEVVQTKPKDEATAARALSDDELDDLIDLLVWRLPQRNISNKRNVARKQGDIIPVWTIVIWEDLDETSKLESLKFRGGYEEAVDYATAKFNFSKAYPEFSVSHFTIE